MAEDSLDNLSQAATGFNDLPVKKKISILFSIFLTIVMAGMVINWSREPALVPLYANLDSKETSKVIDALSKTDIIYRFDGSSGNVLVPVGQIHEVRMKLAALGLPKGSGTGFELLDKPASFGTSQFMENVNYRRALEGELSRTIGSLEGIRAARVHLGLPKQSSFLKKNVISSASVFVDLYSGQELETNQVAGIIHLVSASISGLNRDNVSVIDQRGNLLNNVKSGSKKIIQAQEETNLIRAKEQDLSRKIKELLTPIYGVNSVLAEVTLDIDFSYVEETKENYDNAKFSVKSESLSTEQKTTEEYPEGVPGALSNQPPSAGGAPEEVGADQANLLEEAPPPAPKPKVYRDKADRNYALNRSVSNEVRATSKISKQSISVVINDKVLYGEDGTEQYTPLNEEEIAKVEQIVKEAVGFNADRGDTLSVVNSSFSKGPPLNASGEGSSGGMNATSLLTQTWILSLIKQGLGALFILLVLFIVIKPTIKTLADLKPPPPPPPPPKEEHEEQKLSLPEPDKGPELRLEHVQQITKDDSKKAAQVVMNWLGSEED